MPGAQQVAAGVVEALQAGRWAEAVPASSRSVLRPTTSSMRSICGASHATELHPIPGTLANPGFEGQAIKSVFFFAGQWRFVEAPFYDGPTGTPLRPSCASAAGSAPTVRYRTSR